MPHDLLDHNPLENDDEGENMVSNLPLLFAAGYPTSLDKIGESQLEKFIPFMVQCSLGDIQLPNIGDSIEPEWWPEDVVFSIPLKKPARYAGNWLAKLKEIVAICYTFHKSVFLLRFCENLSMYQPEYLRFINNYNSTTSLFDRISNKLLVTFRNENMLYDQAPVNHKKTLMPRTQSSQSIETHNERMVEQALFDIYLCDNCEAELYSLDAYREHEKICQEDDSDDDVIFCGEEEYEPEDKAQQQTNFLQNFQLCNKSIPFDQQQQMMKHTTPHKRNSHHQSVASSSNNNNINFNNKNSNGKNDLPSLPEQNDKKIRRIPRRTHAAMILSKCPAIPITSPAGQRLISTSNNPVTEGYQRERIERSERFCPAPILGADGSNRPKFMDKKPHTYSLSSYRKNSNHFHFYKFPRRQWSTKSRDEAVSTLQKILLKQSHCRPLRVRVNRLTSKDIESLRAQPKMKKRIVIAKPASKSKIIDFIDLCSSDNESSSDSDGSDTHSDWPQHAVNKNRTLEKPEAIFIVNRSMDEESPLNETIANEKITERMGIIPSCTTVKSQCDSTSNLLDDETIKSFLSNNKSISLFNRINNNPISQENHEICTSEERNSPQTTFLYEKHTELSMTSSTSTNKIPTTIPTNNFISIDLTL